MDRFATHRLISRAAISLHEKAVLWVMWDFENARSGLAWPSGETLAAMTGLSPASVWRALRDLTRRGVVRVHARTPRFTQRFIDYDRLAALQLAHPLEPVAGLSVGDGDLSVGDGDLSVGEHDLSVGDGDLSVGKSELSGGETIRRRTYEQRKNEQAHTRVAPAWGGPGRGTPRAFEADVRPVPEEDFAERIVRLALEQRARNGGLT